jgi:hypothetical protein
MYMTNLSPSRHAVFGSPRLASCPLKSCHSDDNFFNGRLAVDTIRLADVYRELSQYPSNF